MPEKLRGRWQSFIIQTDGDEVILTPDDDINVHEINLLTGEITRGDSGGLPITGRFIAVKDFFAVTIDLPDLGLRFEGVSQEHFLPDSTSVLLITGRTFAPEELRRTGKDAAGADEGAVRRGGRRRADNQEEATWVATKQG